MTDRNKLICLLSKICPIPYREITKVADCLVKNGYTIATDNNVGDKWTPTAERLPDVELVRYKDPCEPNGYGEYYASQEVLIFADRVGVGKYCKGKVCEWWDTDNDIGEDGELPTHWMPLPEEPKEERLCCGPLESERRI